MNEMICFSGLVIIFIGVGIIIARQFEWINGWFFIIAGFLFTIGYLIYGRLVTKE